MRIVTHRYEDPLERIWRHAAGRVGLRVQRCPEVFASTDGRGLLRISTPEHLDADDCLAQMIFHELCHGLVQGPGSLLEEDWGLDLECRDVHNEHACLRLQAWLARPHGLGRVLAPTGEHRPYYDALGPRVLAPATDPVVEAARRAARRADEPPFGPHVQRALAATAAVVRAAAPAAVGTDSLFGLLESPAPREEL